MEMFIEVNPFLFPAFKHRLAFLKIENYMTANLEKPFIFLNLFSFKDS